MDELDWLKKNWNQQASKFKNYTEAELFAMLKGRSVSIAQWVLGIGLLEIFVSHMLVYLLDYFSEKDPMVDLPWFVDFLDYFFSIVPILFLVGLLVLNFKIRNEEKPKKLMKRILLMRKVVEWYINILLIEVATGVLYGLWVSVNEIFIPEYNDNFGEANVFIAVIMVLFFILLGLGAFYGVRYLYKKLIYGKLIAQLKQNYDEIRQIE